MTDKEVGELWRQGHYDGLPHRHPGSVVAALIRKLVAERAMHYDRMGNWDSYKEKALQDFGIDPETFK